MVLEALRIKYEAKDSELLREIGEDDWKALKCGRGGIGVGRNMKAVLKIQEG